MAVDERAGRPGLGVRGSSTYWTPYSSHSRRFSSLPPSSLTTKNSGLISAMSGSKSSIPLPDEIRASATQRIDRTRYSRSSSLNFVGWPFSRRMFSSEPMHT